MSTGAPQLQFMTEERDGEESRSPMPLDRFDQRALSLALQYNDEVDSEDVVWEANDPAKQNYNKLINDVSFNPQAQQNKINREDPFEVLTNKYYLMDLKLEAEGDSAELIKKNKHFKRNTFYT